MNFSDTLGLVSLVLSLVALGITIIGFFASLKFYRDGINLQDSATKALVKIEEKTNLIGNQMTGMFDKTLNAAINYNRSGQIVQDFEDTTEQVEKASRALLDKITSDLKNVGDTEKEKLSKFVTEQFKTITDQVSVAQENAADIVTSIDSEFIVVSQFEAKILNILRSASKPLNNKEIAKEIDLSLAVVEKSIIRLIAKRLILSENDKYTINKQKQKDDFTLVDKAFTNASQGKKSVYLANLGVHIKKLNPTFDVRAYGYESLSDYLKAHSNYKLIDNFINGLNHPLVEKS